MSVNERIAALEAAIRTVLPPRYRDFLWHHPTGFWPKWVSFNDETALERLSTLEELEMEVREEEDLVSMGLLPIGMTTRGILLVELGTATAPCVPDTLWVWDRYGDDRYGVDDEEVPQRLCNDIDNFLEHLKPFPSEIDEVALKVESDAIQNIDEFLAGRRITDPVGYHGEPLAVLAARHGNVRLLGECLDRGAEMSTLVSVAACRGHVSVLKLLVSRGADINEVNESGTTPLGEAWNEDVREFLRSCGAIQQCGFDRK